MLSRHHMGSALSIPSPWAAPPFPPWRRYHFQNQIPFIDRRWHLAADPIEQHERLAIIGEILEHRTTILAKILIVVDDHAISAREALRGSFRCGDDSVFVGDLDERFQGAFDEMTVSDEIDDAENIAKRIPSVVCNQPNVARESGAQTIMSTTAMHAPAAYFE